MANSQPRPHTKSPHLRYTSEVTAHTVTPLSPSPQRISYHRQPWNTFNRHTIFFEKQQTELKESTTFLLFPFIQLSSNFCKPQQTEAPCDSILSVERASPDPSQTEESAPNQNKTITAPAYQTTCWIPDPETATAGDATSQQSLQASHAIRWKLSSHRRRTHVARSPTEPSTIPTAPFLQHQRPLLITPSATYKTPPFGSSPYRAAFIPLERHKHRRTFVKAPSAIPLVSPWFQTHQLVIGAASHSEACRTIHMQARDHLNRFPQRPQPPICVTGPSQRIYPAPRTTETTTIESPFTRASTPT